MVIQIRIVLRDQHFSLHFYYVFSLKRDTLFTFTAQNTWKFQNFAGNSDTSSPVENIFLWRHVTKNSSLSRLLSQAVVAFYTVEIWFNLSLSFRYLSRSCKEMISRTHNSLQSNFQESSARAVAIHRNMWPILDLIDINCNLSCLEPIYIKSGLLYSQ